MSKSKSIYIKLLFFVTTLTSILGYQQTAHATDVDSLFSQLTLEEKIGQLILGIPNNNETLIKSLARENRLGGVLFNDYCNPTLYRYFTNLNKLPNKVKVLLGAKNQESLKCLNEKYQYLPDNYNLGAIKSNVFTYNSYKEIGVEANRLGIDFYLSNALSIHKEASTEYGFGEDINNVTLKNQAAIKGIHQSKILVGSAIDYIKDIDELSEKNQLILKELVKDSLQIILPTEVLFDAPIFTKNIIQHLRDSLKYQGLILTGNLSAGNNGLKTVQSSINALQNGHDLIAVSDFFEEVIKGVRNAVKKGTLNIEVIDEKVLKVLNYKYRQKAVVNDSSTSNEQLKAIISETYEKSLTLLNNTDSLLPLKDLTKKKYQVISIGLKNQEDHFSEMMNRFIDYDYHRIENSSFSTGQVNLLLESCKKKDMVIVNIVCYQNSSKHRFGISYATEQLIDQLQQKTNVIVTIHGSPNGLKYLKGTKNTLINYSIDQEAQYASAQFIAGCTDVNGKLPVSISNQFDLNQGEKVKGLQRLGYGKAAYVGLDGAVLNHLIDSIANHAINIEATPGCQVVVAKNGKIVFEKSYGYFTYEKSIPVTNSTVYDIASITKVAATTQAMMMLDYVDSVNVNNRLKYYISDTDTTNKGNIRLIQFLTHTAPLRGGYYFWGHVYDKETKKYDPTYISSYKKKGYNVEITPNLFATDSIKDCMWKWLLESPISTRRRYTKDVYRYWYSDLGYYFLQRSIEKITDKRLDHYLESKLYSKLGTRNLGYLPLAHGINLKRIPPTEMDIHYRQSLIKGIVHDPSADLMGGVAGHAGIFSNAHDLAILMQMNLQNGFYAGNQFFDEATINKYNRQPYVRFKNRRALGWDKPPLRGDEGNTSPLAPKKTFGHTGFTGTCAWIDPENDIVYIFLSNRVYPTARNNKLAKENIRENIQSAIYQAMGEVLPQ
ncbi:serine hydrolase [Flammeovirga sp. SubArs3]|uniref:serine hydrolase n=1 Tax=Flammeovirga sp. SubArs3 TaxID=2995316 RepID=UPI00248C3F2F|nr:serine hydrolase [Flammeovirga sp. SubArs3]